jgi:hypothetical protein
VNDLLNQEQNGNYCFSASAARKLIPKEKKKKKKALSEGLDEWMQAFRLKNFPFEGAK